MSSHGLVTRSFMVGALLALLVACGSKASESPGANGAGSITGAGSTPGAGDSTGIGSDTGAGGLVGVGSTGSGDAGSSSSGSTSGEGSGSTDSGDGGGSGSSSDGGSDGIGASSGTGATMDVGSGGSEDVGSGGVGGTIDTGTGGTIDTGTGGTIDTCIPTCVPDVLGTGEDAVNLVVFQDATAGGCDTEGRMWVGGNADFSGGYGVGMQLSECDADGYVLVVGGDLNITGGVKGRMWVGGTFSGTPPQCGGVWSSQPAPVDFPALKQHLTAYSNLLAGYPTNGTTSSSFARVTFTGTDPVMNIFEITAAELSAANGFVVDAPVDSTVIVNVTGTGATGFNNGTTTLPDGVTCGSGAVDLDDFCNRLIWNMPNVTEVSVSGTAVQGSILAPNATMTSNGSGQVNGTVIVNEFSISACVEMHPHYFNGCLCTEEVNSPYACCPG